MDGLFGSLLLRVFVRGWCRGNTRHLAIVATWIELLERGEAVTVRHVAAASGQDKMTVMRVLREFRVDVRAAQLEEEALGTSIERWLKDPTDDRAGGREGGND